MPDRELRRADCASAQGHEPVPLVTVVKRYATPPFLREAASRGGQTALPRKGMNPFPLVTVVKRYANPSLLGKAASRGGQTALPRKGMNPFPLVTVVKRYATPSLLGKGFSWRDVQETLKELPS